MNEEERWILMKIVGSMMIIVSIGLLLTWVILPMYDWRPHMFDFFRGLSNNTASIMGVRI